MEFIALNPALKEPLQSYFSMNCGGNSKNHGSQAYKWDWENRCCLLHPAKPLHTLRRAVAVTTVPNRVDQEEQMETLIGMPKADQLECLGKVPRSITDSTFNQLCRVLVSLLLLLHLGKPVPCKHLPCFITLPLIWGENASQDTETHNYASPWAKNLGTLEVGWD